MPNKHNINVFDDLWPKRGEKLKYIWNDSIPAHDYDFDTPLLTCGSTYEILDVRWVPCKDQIFIIDDNGIKEFWVDLIKFNYKDK